jgi:hypothetical protein
MAASHRVKKKERAGVAGAKGFHLDDLVRVQGALRRGRKFHEFSPTSPVLVCEILTTASRNPHSKLASVCFVGNIESDNGSRANGKAKPYEEL